MTGAHLDSRGSLHIVARLVSYSDTPPCLSFPRGAGTDSMTAMTGVVHWTGLLV